MEYRKVDNKNRVIEIFNIIENEIKKGEYIGIRTWGDPAGSYNDDTYALSNGEESIFVNLGEFYCAGSSYINRKVIGVCSPRKDGQSLDTQLAVVLPYEYSKRFNTRIYENDINIQIRNYGRFTVGRKGLARKVFFDYLRNNGYSDEINLDEEGKEFISILDVNKNLDYETIVNSLIKWKNIIEKFKIEQR